jgi:phage terminase Nu1 subunit (DNA packaging protein)
MGRKKANEQGDTALRLAELEAGIIHRDELASLLGLRSPQMLDVHAGQGHLVRASKKGWFKFAASVRSMAEHQRAMAAKHRSGDGKHDVAAESAQLKSAQRRLTELKIKAMEGDLVSATEALSVWGDFAKDVRAMFLALPSRVAGELPHVVASEVEILKRLSRDMLAELKALGEVPPNLKADRT